MNEGAIFFGRTVGARENSHLANRGGEEKKEEKGATEIQLRFLFTSNDFADLLKEVGFKEVCVEDEDYNKNLQRNEKNNKSNSILYFWCKK